MNYPPTWQPVLLAAMIYANFFSHHFVADARWALFAATAWIFRRSWFVYRPFRAERRMPILLGFVLVAFFIWVAENIAMGQTSASEAVSSWMNSSGHRSNMLDGGHTRIGVGVAYSSNGTAYWCQQFR